MRILFIAPKYTGGIGGHAARVAEKLREHGFDIKLMHTPHIPINKLKNPSFAVLSSIKAIMGGDEYDIVHAFNIPSAFAMRYTKAKKKILSVHGIYSEQVDSLHSDTTAKAASVTESKVFKWADRLTTDSKAVSVAYNKKLGVKFEFLYAPLDITKFSDLPDVPKKEKQVIYIGRDSYEKGIDILRDVELKINGHVVYCTDLEWKETMSQLKASSVLVVPSRMESIPQVIKEAFFLNIGTGIPTSIKELANLMIKLSGKSLSTKFDELPQGDIKESQADANLAKKTINWSYETGLETGLKHFFFS